MSDNIPRVSDRGSDSRRHRQLVSEAVREQIADEIARGRYEPGEKLPSEPDLAQRYGISRPTMREILSGLERAGMVRRVHGVGTFVTREPARVRSVLDLDIGVTEAVTAAQANLGIDVVRAATEPAPGWISDVLKLDPETPVFTVERIIKVDGRAATHGFDVIPASVITNAPGSPSYDGGSVYRFLEESCGVELSGGLAEISPVLVSPQMAKLLGCARNTPLLRLEQIERSIDGQPVLLSQEHYLPEVFSLTVHRQRRRK